MKKVLLGIVGLIVLAVVALAIIAFVSPTEFNVEREVVINRPKGQVFSYLKLLRNQNDWGPWTLKDPDLKQSYTGTDGEVGFISRWESESEELGVGEQEIKKIVDGERIDVELRFIKPWEATNAGYLITEAEGDDATKVRWGFAGSMPRPMNLMLVFTEFEGLVGKDFEEGLANLKTILETLPEPKKEPGEVETGDAQPKT